MPEKPPASARRETALSQGAEAAGVRDEARALLDALAGRVTDPDSRRRAERVRKSLTERKKDPLENEAVVRGFSEFLDALGGAGNGQDLIEAYQVAYVRGFTGSDVARFIKSLPGGLAAKFSPHRAAKCLAARVEVRDVATACEMGLDAPATEEEWSDYGRMLQELCSLPGFRSLASCCDFRKGVSTVRVRVGKKEIDPASSPNLFRGLLEFARDGGKTPSDTAGWKRTAERYAASVDEYLAGDRAPQAAFCLIARPQEDPTGAFSGNRSLLADGLRSAAPGAKIHDVSDGGFPALLAQARAYADTHKGSPFLIYVALHGIRGGGAQHALGDLTAQDFRALADLSPNATVQLEGCFAGDNFAGGAAQKGTLLLGSSSSQKYEAFDRELASALADPASDLDGDGKVGWREARLAVFLRWRKSFLPTSFTPAGRAPVRLAAQGRSPDAAQA